MVKITKKITAIVLAGILMAGSVGGTPTLVEAKTTKTSSTKVNWSKKYPKLKNPKKKDIKKVAYSKETNAKINRIIKKLDQLEKKFSMKQLKSIWKDICDLNLKMPQEDVEVHEEKDQLDYIIYKATYYSFIYIKGKERDKFFVQLADNIYLSSARRWNNRMESYLMIDYSVYFKYAIKDFLIEEQSKHTLINLTSMLIDISNYSLFPPDNSESYEDYYNDKINESNLPSNIKGDEDNSWVTFVPEELPPLQKAKPVKPEEGATLTPPKKKQTNEQQTKDKEKTTGLSFEKYCKEAVKLGFKKSKFQDPSGTTQEAYGYMVNGIPLGNISVCNDFRGRNLQIVMKNGYHTNPSYKKWKITLQKSFDLLLPTQGKELFDIVSQKDIKDKIITKTFTMDGREVTVVVDEAKDPKTNKQEKFIIVVFR